MRHCGKTTTITSKHEKEAKYKQHICNLIFRGKLEVAH